MSDPMGGSVPTSVTMDEIEQLQQDQPEADLSKVTLVGDDVPEDLRGKSVKDALARLGGLSEALKVSEQARKQAETNAQLALSGRQDPPKSEEPPAPKELTEDELRELYEENPLQAISVMQDQAIRRAERNLESRLGPMMTGTAAQVENAVRAKYADEFELFGDQITSLAASVPNGKAVLSNPAAWDDLIALVRGRPGNIEKLITKKTSGRTVDQARQEQIGATGFTGSGGQRGTTREVGGQLDPIQKEIAEKLDMSEADYIKWSKV